ncbi:hypothetical protein QYF36_026017 [Acer negundo]|nr:hypothetical protein QYF36_026017 [Acer negundo]
MRPSSFDYPGLADHSLARSGIRTWSGKERSGDRDGCSVAVPGVPHMGVYHQLMCPGNGDLRRSDVLLLMASDGIKRIL